MSKAKKTFYVESLKNDVNEFLKNSTCSPDRRQGRIDVLSDILHTTGNYKGFTYLSRYQVPYNELPGIVINGTIEDTPSEVRFDPKFSDRTRVKFF